jgi:hypothetical protein
MADPLTIHEDEKYGPSIVFACGTLPVDDAVMATGHEPNGYFWESLTTYVAPEVASALRLDCEAGMFTAYGDHAALGRLREALGPYVSDGDRVTEVIARAEAEGFVFDD